MKITVCLMVAVSCVYNWISAMAFAPIRSLFYAKKTNPSHGSTSTATFYKTLSGLLNSNSNLMGLVSTYRKSTHMPVETNTRGGDYRMWFLPNLFGINFLSESNGRNRERRSISRTPAAANPYSSAVYSAGSIPIYEAQPSLVEQLQSDGDLMNAKLVGFMEFDPKTAAKNAHHKRVGNQKSQLRHRSRQSSSSWFSL